VCRAVSVQPVCPPKYLHESTSNPHQLKENGQTKASALRSNITSSWEMVRTHSRTTCLSLSQPVRNLLPILTLPHEPHQEPHPRCDCPNDSWQAVGRTPRTRLERGAAFFLSHSGWHPWTLEFVGDCSLEGNAEFFAFCMGCGFHPYLQGKRTKWSPLQRNIHPTMISRGGGICSNSARGC